MWWWPFNRKSSRREDDYLDTGPRFGPRYLRRPPRARQKAQVRLYAPKKVERGYKIPDKRGLEPKTTPFEPKFANVRQIIAKIEENTDISAKVARKMYKTATGEKL